MSQSTEAVYSETLEERYRTLSENEDYPTLASRLSAIRERRPDSNISPEAVLAAMEKSEAWQTREDPGRAQEKLTEEELNDGRAFIEFDTVKVETLMPGDHMDISIDAIGLSYDVKIDNVETFDDGNIMWSGSIMNAEGTEAEGGTINITQSSKITVASVVLKETDFTIESYGSDGWMVDSGVLFKVDPNKTDAIIPPDHGHQH